ncbi:phragmoplast orienting kinesin-1 [Dorcoceras hygrometricum]|uniref:Phragmoplast orienting kinesin-1 n=1 Tax=Dorcoceras hygrometricum TaxID=472368 RepID=A0A2Z7ACW6_9LAMI|nr:phragmoplast orienting kinesin-1 [Dorcoceras hygrometricum]
MRVVLHKLVEISLGVSCFGENWSWLSGRELFGMHDLVYWCNLIQPGVHLKLSCPSQAEFTIASWSEYVQRDQRARELSRGRKLFSVRELNRLRELIYERNLFGEHEQSSECDLSYEHDLVTFQLGARLVSLGSSLQARIFYAILGAIGFGRVIAMIVEAHDFSRLLASSSSGSENPGSTAGRGFNPAGGAPGGG